jgi:hypothetical protein
MVSKCANPDCPAVFQYLRDGKVYRLEVQDFGDELMGDDRKPPKRVEHFWLCGDCARTMRISFDGVRKVDVIPVERPLYRRAAASH